MLTRLESSEPFEHLERRTVDRIRECCPEVEWEQNLAVMGPYHYVDVFRAPDNETAMKVATIVRSHGGAHSEVLPAADWEQYREVTRGVDA